MGFIIGNIEISSKGVFNIEKRIRREREDIINRILKTSLSRITQRISDWKNATLTAESVFNPLNYPLIAVYRDIETDAHLFALMQTVVLKVLSNDFCLEDENGERNEEATKIFKKKWFRKFLIHTVNSRFYGYSLIQLGDIINGAFKDAVLVPRDYVNQRLGVVQKSLMSSQDGIPWDEPPFKFWVIGVGDSDDLGLLHKAAPLVIKKKEVIVSWSLAAEVFGMPIRVGKTNITSPTNRKNMEEMLENMGEAAWGVFDKEDDITFVETKKTDYYKIYDQFIDRANSEISKLILLQTGTTDEKSFVGSAEVHNSILKDLIESVVGFSEEVVNDQLIPVCEFHGLIPSGLRYKALNEQKLSLKDMLEALKVILTAYKVSPDWINDTFDIPAEEKGEAPDELQKEVEKIDTTEQPEKVMEKVQNIYKKFFNKSCNH